MSYSLLEKRLLGVPSFKLYMAYKNILQVDDGALLQALRRAGECGALVCVHCENGIVRGIRTMRQNYWGLAEQPSIGKLRIIKLVKLKRFPR